MLNTTIVDRRSTTQEVHNHTETNVETSGNISKSENTSRFISFDTSKQAYKTVFASEPFYVECVQKEDGRRDREIGRHSYKETAYKEIKTKIFISVKQVLVTGKIFTLEIEEIKKKDVSDSYNWGDKKSIYFNNPTII